MTALVRASPSDLRSSTKRLPPPTNRPSLASWSISTNASGCSTVSASMVTTISPADAATPALRVAAMLRCPSITTVAPASVAMASVRSVQRLAATTTSAVAPAVRTASSIATSPRPSSCSSLCAGTTIENLGRTAMRTHRPDPSTP